LTPPHPSTILFVAGGQALQSRAQPIEQYRPLGMMPGPEDEDLLRSLLQKLPTNIVTTDEQLRGLCERLTRGGTFAFDTEFVMEDSYESEVCLIQVATQTEVALIDPLSGLDTSRFWQLVADPGIEVVLHAGMEDLALCYKITGQPPANVFDVQIAAGLVSPHYPMSLSKLVQYLLRIRLRKSQTLTDWRRRPLTPEQQHYAIEDVIYIPPMHEILTNRLDSMGRNHWTREEFAHFGQVESYKPTERARLTRIKGAGSLDGRGLAILGELIDTREELAQKFNRPARVILKDYLLVEIAKHSLTTPEQIRSLRGINLRSSAIQMIAEAVERGKAISPDQRPTPANRTDDSPGELATTALIMAVLRQRSEAQRIAFQLLATKESVRQLVLASTRDSKVQSPLLSGWRAELCGQLLDDLLTGKAAVKIDCSKSDPELAIVPLR
jgi:ribonuclease D